MKKIIVSFMLSLAVLTGFAGEKNGRIEKERLISIVNDCSHMEGADVVKMGSFGTAAVKSLIRSAADEKDTKQILDLIKGIKRVAIVDYEDCTSSQKRNISRRIENALADSELLMEMKDGEDMMRMYGVLEEGSSTIRDFVLYTPGDCALICLFGKISMDAIKETIR